MSLKVISAAGGLAQGLSQGLLTKHQMDLQRQEFGLRKEDQALRRTEAERRALEFQEGLERDRELYQLRRAELEGRLTRQRWDEELSRAEAQLQGELLAEQRSSRDARLSASRALLPDDAGARTIGGVEIDADVWRLRSIMTAEDRKRFDTEELIPWVEEQALARQRNAAETHAANVLQQASQGLLPLTPDMVQVAQTRIADATSSAEVQQAEAFLDEMVRVAQHEYRVLQARTILGSHLQTALGRAADAGVGGEAIAMIQHLMAESLKLPANTSAHELRRYEEELQHAVMKAAVLAGQQGPAAAALFARDAQQHQQQLAAMERQMRERYAGIAPRQAEALTAPESQAIARQLDAARSSIEVSAILAQHGLDDSDETIRAIARRRRTAAQDEPDHERTSRARDAALATLGLEPGSQPAEELLKLLANPSSSGSLDDELRRLGLDPTSSKTQGALSFLASLEVLPLSTTHSEPQTPAAPRRPPWAKRAAR